MKQLTEVGRKSAVGDRFVPDMSHLVLPPHLELGHTYAETPSHRRARAGLDSLLRHKTIGLIDGEPGLGKTTFAQWAAQSAGVPSAIAVMPENPAPLDLLRICITAVTGYNPQGATKTQMEAELIAELSRWQGLLIIDEVQNVRYKGLAEARYLHDITRPKFPMLLVGYRALATVRENPALDSRVRIKRKFRPLEGEDLFATIRQIAPAFQGVSDDVIRYADDKYCLGNLRRWMSLIETAGDLAMDQPNRADIDDLLIELEAA